MFKKNKVDNKTMSEGARIVTGSEATSINSEQFNSIRANIKFSNVDQSYKSILITSSIISEGKSTISANIATAFAKDGMKTLFVDVDFRRPTFNASFNLTESRGLTNFLTEKNFDPNDLIYKTSQKNLFIIPSGPIPPNPSELIGSNKMKRLMASLEQKFDLVIYDAPPILAVSDSKVLSVKVDATILVVRYSFVKKESVVESIKELNHVGANLIGTIFNNLPSSENVGYYGYYSKDN